MRRAWRPRTDRSHFIDSGSMPSLFGSFDRTQLVALLATYGPMQIPEIAAAFNVNYSSALRRVRAAARTGLLERCRATADFYRVDPQHPIYGQIIRLARRLGRVYPLPVLKRRGEVHAVERVTPTREYNAIETLGTRLSPMRGEILLLLFALSEPIPINFIAGMLGRRRFSVCNAINAFETFGVVTCVRESRRRLVLLDRSWPAYRELHGLLAAIAQLDSQWQEYAASYRSREGGRVSYNM